MTAREALTRARLGALRRERAEFLLSWISALHDATADRAEWLRTGRRFLNLKRWADRAWRKVSAWLAIARAGGLGRQARALLVAMPARIREARARGMDRARCSLDRRRSRRQEFHGLDTQPGLAAIA